MGGCWSWCGGDAAAAAAAAALGRQYPFVNWIGVFENISTCSLFTVVFEDAVDASEAG